MIESNLPSSTGISSIVAHMAGHTAYDNTPSNDGVFRTSSGSQSFFWRALEAKKFLYFALKINFGRNLTLNSFQTTGPSPTLTEHVCFPCSSTTIHRYDTSHSSWIFSCSNPDSILSNLPCPDHPSLARLPNLKIAFPQNNFIFFLPWSLFFSLKKKLNWHNKTGSKWSVKA